MTPMGRSGSIAMLGMVCFLCCTQQCNSDEGSPVHGFGDWWQQKAAGQVSGGRVYLVNRIPVNGVLYKVYAFLQNTHTVYIQLYKQGDEDDNTRFTLISQKRFTSPRVNSSEVIELNDEDGACPQVNKGDMLGLWSPGIMTMPIPYYIATPSEPILTAKFGDAYSPPSVDETLEFESTFDHRFLIQGYVFERSVLGRRKRSTAAPCPTRSDLNPAESTTTVSKTSTTPNTTPTTSSTTSTTSSTTSTTTSTTTPSTTSTPTPSKTSTKASTPTPSTTSTASLTTSEGNQTTGESVIGRGDGDPPANNNTVIIAVVVAVGLVVIIVTIIIVFCVLKLRSRSSNNTPKNNGHDQFENPSFSPSGRDYHPPHPQQQLHNGMSPRRESGQYEEIPDQMIEPLPVNGPGTKNERFVSDNAQFSYRSDSNGIMSPDNSSDYLTTDPRTMDGADIQRSDTNDTGDYLTTDPGYVEMYGNK